MCFLVLYHEFEEDFVKKLLPSGFISMSSLLMGAINIFETSLGKASLDAQ